MRLKHTRTLPIALGVVVIAAALVVAVQLRKSAPPEPARLLPGADAFLYANFGWVRKINSSTKPMFPVAHDPDYERFIRRPASIMSATSMRSPLPCTIRNSGPEEEPAEPHPNPGFPKYSWDISMAAKCTAYLKQTARSDRKLRLGRHLYDPDFRANVPDRFSRRGHSRRLESRRRRSHPRNDRPLAASGLSLRRPAVPPALLQARSTRQPGMADRPDRSLRARLRGLVRGFSKARQCSHLRQLQPVAPAATRRRAPPPRRSLGG